MKITNDFKTKMAETFYDKEITLYTQERVVDDEGFAVRSVEESETTVMANVLTNHTKLMEEYGIVERFDLAFTCDPDEDVQADSIISYQSKTYKVSTVKITDTHKLVIAQSWSSKSSTSPSA